MGITLGFDWVIVYGVKGIILTRGFFQISIGI